MAYSVSRVFWVRLGCDNKQYPRPTTLRAARILAKSIFAPYARLPARVSRNTAILSSRARSSFDRPTRGLVFLSIDGPSFLSFPFETTASASPIASSRSPFRVARLERERRARVARDTRRRARTSRARGEARVPLAPRTRSARLLASRRLGRSTARASHAHVSRVPRGNTRHSKPRLVAPRARRRASRASPGLAMRARSRARAPAPPALGSLRGRARGRARPPPADEKTTNLLVDTPVVRSKREEAPERDAPPAAASAVAVVAIDPIGRASPSPEGAPRFSERAMPSTCRLHVDDALASFAHAEMLKTLDHSAGDSSAASGLTSAVFDEFPGAAPEFDDALGGAADAFAEPTPRVGSVIDRQRVGSDTLAAARAETHQTHQTRLGEDAAARAERIERLEAPASGKNVLRKEFFPREPNAFGRDWFDFEYAPPPDAYAAYEDASVGGGFFPPPHASSAYDAELAAELYGDAAGGVGRSLLRRAMANDKRVPRRSRRRRSRRWRSRRRRTNPNPWHVRDFRGAFPWAPPTRATTNAPPSPRARRASAKRRRAGTARDLGVAAKKPRGVSGVGGVGAHMRGGARSTSKFRGVTHHCRTGRWEAHIWEDGKQVYLGGFDSEHQAALAYDVAAVKCRGDDAVTNFCMEDYAQELRGIANVNKEELVLSLRRQSKGFAKGSSKYRGVTRHQKGRWEARIGQLVGKKYRYLGLFDTEEDAAVAYDAEAVRQKGFDAVTNFDLAEYADELAAHTTSAKGSGKRQRVSEDGENPNTEQDTSPKTLAIAPARAADVAARAQAQAMRPGPSRRARAQRGGVDGGARVLRGDQGPRRHRRRVRRAESRPPARVGPRRRRRRRRRRAAAAAARVVAARKSKHAKALLTRESSDPPNTSDDALDVVGGVCLDSSKEEPPKRRAGSVAPDEDALELDAAAREEVSARAGGTVQALRAMVEEAKAELASARREMRTLISEKKEQKKEQNRANDDRRDFLREKPRSTRRRRASKRRASKRRRRASRRRAARRRARVWKRERFRVPRHNTHTRDGNASQRLSRVTTSLARR